MTENCAWGCPFGVGLFCTVWPSTNNSTSTIPCASAEVDWTWTWAPTWNTVLLAGATMTTLGRLACADWVAVGCACWHAANKSNGKRMSENKWRFMNLLL